MTDDNLEAIQRSFSRIDGTPKEINPREAGFFSAFKKLVLPRIKRNEKLIDDYMQAKAKIEYGESETKIENAAKISAERDKLIQEDFKIFCETVDSHFEGVNDAAKIQLKMAKLLETNPKLEDQIKKINLIISNLEDSKGLIMDILEEDHRE